jgi:hypothetical protein
MEEVDEMKREHSSPPLFLPSSHNGEKASDSTGSKENSDGIGGKNLYIVFIPNAYNPGQKSLGLI